MPGRVRTEIHLSAEDTGGAFCLLVDELPVEWSLPAHRHRDASEGIHVIEGCVEMRVDGEERTLRRGDTIHLPAGIDHEGRNAGEVPARRIVIFSPAGMERLVEEIGADQPDAEIDPGLAMRAATRFGWEFTG